MAQQQHYETFKFHIHFVPDMTSVGNSSTGKGGLPPVCVPFTFQQK